MKKYTFLVWPVVLVSAFLMIVPFLETVLSVWPLRPGDVNWRFGAAGIYSRALMTPLLGLLLLFAIAAMLEMQRTVRVAAVVSGAGAVVLLALLVIFALDALQTRSNVQVDNARRVFDVGALFAIIKFAWAAITLGILSITAFRTAARWRSDEKAPVPIVTAGSPRSAPAGSARD